jgi:hypothetical protein
MFALSIIKAIEDRAKAAKIEPAALLALVECETSGTPFEQDGRTPAFLYERHIAYREAKKKSGALQAAFVRAGLAIPKWSKATQYKDEGTSAKRLDLIARARKIDEEVANRSASWGLGQTMGFLARDLGYASATEMVAKMSGNVPAQIDGMIAELRKSKLVDALNAHDWAHVARGYNGPSYAANRYDTRLADAHKRWLRRLDTIAGGSVAASAELAPAQIKAAQVKLRALGYHGVGATDGRMGRNTIGAISAFQAHEGLPVNGQLDEATLKALDGAEPVEVSRERDRATADDLKAQGSKTITAADHAGLLGKLKAIGGGAMVCGGGAEKLGLLDRAQDGVDKVNQAKGIWESVQDLAQPALDHPAVIVAGVVLIVAGVATWWIAEQIKAHRLADHRSGVHAGPIEG